VVAGIVSKKEEKINNKQSLVLQSSSNYLSQFMVRRTVSKEKTKKMEKEELKDKRKKKV
jgi:hypothetical protein